MADYTETYTKVTGNVIDAEDFEVEFDAIVTAMDTKANKILSGTANNVVEQNASGDLVDTGIPTESVVTLTGVQTLSYKTFTDSVTFFADNSDATKKWQFQIAGIATGTTRTWTVPDISDTFVGKATTDVLINKSIDADNNTITNVGSAELTTSTTEGNYAPASGNSQVLDKGFWLLHTQFSSSYTWDAKFGATWRSFPMLAYEPVSVWSDGTNVRVRNVSGTSATIYYRKLD